MLVVVAACDLERVYGEVEAALPVVPDDDAFSFDLESLPQVPTTLSSDRLVLVKGVRDTDSCHRGDRVIVLAEGATLRRLGVLTLAVLFHPLPTTVEVLLVHPASTIKSLRVRFQHAADQRNGYWAKPTTLEYGVQSPFPLIGIDVPHDRPGLRLTSRDELTGVTDEEWNARDTVVGFGGQQATVAMATLLLDAAVFPHPSGEYTLEGPTGNDVLEPLSADISLALPNSVLGHAFDVR